MQIETEIIEEIEEADKAVFKEHDEDMEEIETGEIEKEQVIGEFEWFQAENYQSLNELENKISEELEDNRIGQMVSLKTDIHTNDEANNLVDTNTVGLIRLFSNSLDTCLLITNLFSSAILMSLLHFPCLKRSNILDHSGSLNARWFLCNTTTNERLLITFFQDGHS